MLGYRTILTAEPTQQNLDQILSVLQRWVTVKKHFTSLPEPGETLENPPGATLTASVFSTETAAGRRLELVEEWDPPNWSTVVSSTRTAVLHVTLVVTSENLWFWVDIEPPSLTLSDRDGRMRTDVQYAGTPGFMSEMLEAVDLRDGLIEPKSKFQAITELKSIDHLVLEIEDCSRTGAVFVTSPPPGLPLEEWIEQSNRRSYAMQGLAVGYALSPDVLVEFNFRAKFGHFVPPGGMRTFIPGADLTSTHDAIHHRLMHPSTLRDSDERRVRRILRGAQVQRLRGIRLPVPLREADYEFLLQRRMRPFDVLHEDGTGLSSEFTENVLSHGSEGVADLHKRLKEAEEITLATLEENDRLQRERDDALDEAELERMEAEQSYVRYSRENRENEKLISRVEYLRAELSALGAGAAAWTGDPDSNFREYPNSFAELMSFLGDLRNPGNLPGVRFSGNRDEASELDEHSALGEAAVTKVWDALLTFDAYSKTRDAGEFEGSLSKYIKFGKHGGLVRIGKVVWSEGQTSKTGRFGAQRIFPVDEKVDSSGTKTMVAHVKLSNLTGVAPRMYFEDTYSSVGYVTVGYLGSHLDNTLTN